MIIRKLSAVLLVSMLFFGATLAQAADYKTKLTLKIASAGSVYDEAYVLTVPEEVAISKPGWNSLGNIEVKYSGTNAGFDPSKKLVITATSTNNFTLVANGVSDTVTYFLATGENDTGATTTFEFTAAEITTTGTSKTIGVKVGDYSNKAAGDYEDEITYSVAVQNTLITVTWNASDITQENYSDNQFSKDGITIYSNIDFNNNSFGQGTTFTTPLGHFTKIEIEATSDNLGELGNGWTVSGNTATWTGSDNNVIFGGEDYIDVLKIVFTIEPQS